MRTVNAEAQALLDRIAAGERIPIAQLLEMRFPVTERYTTAGSDKVWDGHAWSSLGMQMAPIADEVGNLPGLSFTLPGVSDTALATVLSDQVEGVEVVVYDALIDPETGAVHVVDAAAWTGTLNLPSITDGRRATITLTAEHRGVVALRPKPVRYTDEAQQRLYPGDTALAFDPATDAAPVVWPSAAWFYR